MKDSTILILALAVGTLGLGWAGPAKADDLAVALAFEKPVFLKGEIISFCVTITNTSQHDIKIPVTWQQNDRLLLNLNISGNARTVNPFSNPFVHVMYDDTITLAPGETYDALGGIESIVQEGFVGSLKASAVFECDGRYKSGFRKYGPCWNGKVESNWAEVAINEPQTDEDKAAYALLTNNGKLTGSRLIDVSRDVLKSVMERYPKSPYARLACYVLAGVTLVTERPDRALELLPAYQTYARTYWPNDLLVTTVDYYMVQAMAKNSSRAEAERLIDDMTQRPDLRYVRNGLASIVHRYSLSVVDAPLLKLPENDLTKQMQKTAESLRENPSPPAQPGAAMPTATPAAPPKAFPWYYIVIGAAVLALTLALILTLKRKK